eukprot:CAMPEP_0183323650 /NCGR_PEP_ID=MMETSP0160_2-20130417/74996_1 /TAXON_ID=2839 ORGANISM="Odontella Sinensis, Strain Grunow 1884" /NCGR_SAMPLE_ID=MMETSP0160_2 /ASSEMBLY_ACC=CAM_ASM_000250 /LENGTH=107 /DNA_ID=CAMNT_0025491071 /DNA_START=352 /DNA_END=672 /DNA_ORIENTATION=+
MPMNDRISTGAEGYYYRNHRTADEHSLSAMAEITGINAPAGAAPVPMELSSSDDNNHEAAEETTRDVAILLTELSKIASREVPPPPPPPPTSLPATVSYDSEMSLSE